MQSLNKNKKVKIRVKKKKFKKLSIFQLQNCSESDHWGNWVNKRNI
mgnify:FL=1|jgi:hypothetical protein